MTAPKRITARISRALLITLASLAFFSLSASAAPDQPQKFHFRFTKGDVLNYSFKMDGTGAVTIAGIPGLEKTTGKKSMDIPFDMSSYMEVEMKVDSVDKNGAATIGVRLTGMKLNTGTATLVDSFGDGDIPDFAQEMLDNPFKISMTPAGAVTITTPPLKATNELLKKMPGASLPDLLKQSLVSFPDKPLAVGDKWPYHYEMDMPWVQAKKIAIDYELELLGYEKIKEINCAVIGIALKSDLSKQIDKISFPMPDGKGTFEIKVEKLTQDYSGKVYFAPGPGLLVGSRIDVHQVLGGNMKIPGSDLLDPVSFNTDMDFSIETELQ